MLFATTTLASYDCTAGLIKILNVVVLFSSPNRRPLRTDMSNKPPAAVCPMEGRLNWDG